jgi:SAM-dependent methyltransferase
MLADLDDYHAAFRVRAASYIAAVNEHPDVLAQEFGSAAQMVIEQLPPSRPCVVVQLEAGGSVAPALSHPPKNVSFTAFESHAAFVDQCEPGLLRLSRPDRLPLEDSSVDCVLIVAVLHHFDDVSRRAVYEESLRVLRPGGKLVVGDVAEGSPQAKWLNGPVHEFNPFGHNGVFFDEREADRLLASGFIKIETRSALYAWKFDSSSQRIDFLRRLFFLVRASDDQIEQALRATFVMHGDGAPLRSYDLPWQLLYFVATKPG